MVMRIAITPSLNASSRVLVTALLNHGEDGGWAEHRAGGPALPGATVPDAAPYVFASLQSGDVEVFLNAPEPAIAEYPAFKDKPIGGTLTLFIQVVGIERVYESLKAQVDVVMPLEKKWYGVTEFAFKDPDGYLITFAEHGE